MSVNPTLYFPNITGNAQDRGHGFYFADNTDVARIEDFVIQARQNQVEPVIRLQDAESGTARTFSIVAGQAFELTYEPVSAEDQTKIHEDAKAAVAAGILTITSWKADWFVTNSGYASNPSFWEDKK